MKTKSFVLTWFLSVLILFNTNSQEIIEKNYFDNNKELGGDVVIKKSTVKVEGSKTYKIFDVESPDGGSYYINAWLIGAELNNFGSGKFNGYDLIVNDEKQTDKFTPEKYSWHNVPFKDSKLKEKKAIKLRKGLNQVIFSCNAPEIPGVEFIRLSKDKAKTEISESSYSRFISQIKTQVQERIKNPEARKDTTHKLKSGVILPNPAGNYYQHIGITFRYTFYYAFYFNPGQNVFFSTYASDGYEHVIEVFSDAHPEKYSWVAKSNSGGMASLNITIPNSDAYWVRVRAYRQETQGLVDLNVNGQYYYTDCAVSGSGFRHAHETPTTYNYFTCKVTGDSHIWVEDDGGTPGKIRAFNDDYYGGGGDFNWNLASRVKKDFSVRIGAVLVSAFGTNPPTGTCDLYIMCQNSTIGPSSSFPNIKADDAIQSAAVTNVYNCASWAGGITDGWFWGCKYPNQSGGSCISYFYGSPYAWYTWEDYFGNYPVERYEGAMTYTDEGANSSNGSIAVWSTNGDASGITHFSVRNYSNNHPHGYDWESKPGSNMRTFHPRDALNGSLYGSIFAYFKEGTGLKSSQTNKIMTFDESVALGLTVVEDIKLTDTEKNILKSANESNSSTELGILFEKWRQTLYNPELSANSNPYLFFENEEFNRLYDYCSKNEKSSITYLADKLFGDNLTSFESEITSIFFCGFAAKNYKNLLDEIKTNHRLKSYTDEGAYIAPTALNTTKKFIKKILMTDNNSIAQLTGDIDESKYDGYDYLNIYPNPIYENSYINIKLDIGSMISINIYDFKGGLAKTLVSNQLYNSGQYSVEFNSFGLKPGIYVCKIQIDNETACRKILVK